MTKIIALFLSTSLTGINVPIGIFQAPAALLLSEKAIEEKLCDKDLPENIPCEISEDDTISEEVEPKTVEEIVRNYFSDAPVLVEIARCESSFRQSDENQNILRGVINSRDVGIMQINEYFHLEKALKMSVDIYSIEGNLEFARYLYEREGTKPWKASQKCWQGNA